ncbi:MAG: tripartite tricarboxylate transporter permease [Deltaproteobacteria bacterium]|jgi:putative tricarboxylic transport membrane protein|nr:tripartite tricarboxylate transporter permease [Deltaproteobacteria bacterium]
MDIFSGLLSGFQVIFQPVNFLYCFLGVFVGTLIGVLPGIGPVGAMSILLPTTFGVSPIAGVVMLAGIYYGAMYGGSTTSILVNIPGEAASVITCLDGYQMARKGRAGPALGMAALGSFIGGTFSIIALMFLAYPLSEAAVKFGPPEYFSLMCMGLVVVTYLARGSLSKALVMAILGLILGVVGTDPISGKLRFTLGFPDLADGIDLVPLAMGLFGISEVLTNIEKPIKRMIFQTKIQHLLPTREDWKNSVGPIVRGSFTGFFLGILPGGGSILSSFVSYSMEKKISKHPEKFGTGIIEGIAGPETANNAATGGAFVPLLALGIPPNIVMALLFGALLVHGVYPGPMLIKQHPEIFWGTIASMYVGNAMLLVLNLPLIGLWVKLLKVPYRILFPLILLFTLIGSYTINNKTFDVLVMICFGLVGYILRKFQYEEAPLILAFILGPILEQAFRQSLIMSNGSLAIFVSRPIAFVALALSAALLASTVIGIFRQARKRVAEIE